MLLWLLACRPDKADDTAPPTSGEFSALSYNVHGLPEAITGDDTSGRMTQIGPLLAGYDVVGLQEDFDDANHEALAQASGHPTQVRFADLVEEGRYYGPGLALFADFPASEEHNVHYTDCYGVLDSASDCLASKGLQVVRLRVGAAEIDVYNTHMEAGNDPEDNAAREPQVDQILEALAGFSADRAVLFLGDTNMAGDDPEDIPLTERLLSEGGLADACDLVGCPEPGRIDKVLIRSGGGVALEAREWWVAAEFVDPAGVPLSDHSAIASTIGWSAE